MARVPRLRPVVVTRVHQLQPLSGVRLHGVERLRLDESHAAAAVLLGPLHAAHVLGGDGSEVLQRARGLRGGHRAVHRDVHGHRPREEHRRGEELRILVEPVAGFHRVELREPRVPERRERVDVAAEVRLGPREGLKVDAHEDFLAAVEAEEVDAEQRGVAEVTLLARRVVHAAGVHDAVEDLRLFASVDVGEPRAADERGGVDPRLASHLARDGRAGELRGRVNRGQRAQGTIERSEQKLHVVAPADGRGVVGQRRELDRRGVTARVERGGGEVIDRGVALVDAAGVERIGRGARGRDA